jgi:hypothetical protein
MAKPTTAATSGQSQFTSYFVQGSPLGSFEIGSLQFLRSQAYIDYFNHLDKAGGFSYERWGDAVSLAGVVGFY